jgi:hypothetical protein
MSAARPCPYCRGSYAGLTRHLDSCRVRRDELERERRRDEPATVNVNVTNYVDARTLNVTIIATQRDCAQHAELFAGYAQRLLAEVARDPAPWRAGLDAARARIREIEAAATAASPDDQAITRLLRGEEINIECGAEADGDKVVEHAVERVEAIEAAALAEIRRHAPDAVRAALDAAKSLFDF